MKISDKFTFITKISTILTVLTMFSVLTGGLSAFASNIFCRTSNYEGVTGFATAPNVDFGPYMKRMQDKIKSYWAPPAMDLNAQIVVKYRILKNGSLKKDVDAFYKGKRVYLIPHRTYHQECFSVRGDNGDVLNLPDKAKLLY